MCDSFFFFFFSSRRRHTRSLRDWSSDVCSSDLGEVPAEHDVEVSGGILQVVGEEPAAVENGVSLLVFRQEMRFGRGHQQVLAVDLVGPLGKKANVRG